MTYFEWTDRLCLNIHDIDDEHQRIVASMNQLYDLSEARAPFAELERAVVNLERVTVQHFAHEERVMEAMKYPKIATHKIIHKTLLTELAQHKARFISQRQGLDIGFFRFLKGWLSAHIAGIDRQYASYHEGQKIAG